VPKVANPDWNRHPIDAFIAAEHARLGLAPRPIADKRVLLRRVYLDLIGLPPTRTEMDAFLADRSSDAFEKVVDRLLASPRYGERWGRHWMDVWRYSDWDGFGAEVRNSQPHIWHWRDWIIESLNTDKPYDRMIVEMLAGDETAPDDPQTLRATGFLVRNWFKFNRSVWIDHTIEHTSKAFLALTINCSRCHEHKYDPIPQSDYFALRAIFEPHDIRTDRLPGQPDLKRDGIPRVFDANLQAPTYLFDRGEESKPDKTKPIAPGLPAMFATSFKPQPINLPPSAVTPENQAFVIAETRAALQTAAINAANANSLAQRSVARAIAGMLGTRLPPSVVRPILDAAELAEAGQRIAELELAAFDAVLKAEKLDNGKNSPEWQAAAKDAQTRQRQLALTKARRDLVAAQSELRKAPPANRAAVQMKVANAEKAVAKAQADAAMAPTTAYTKRAVKSYPATSTGRRLAFAKWITDPANPLTARVAVNHIWMRHFGKPLVPTVFDFGKNGQPPSHPALLDWLAIEFTRQGWSMKSLHRAIVTSRAYRSDSGYSNEAGAIDPDNRYLWRFSPRRAEGEVVRDSVLHVSGQLELTMGGPDLEPNQALASRRRSVYFRHSVEKNVEFLKLFDGANVNDCYRRSESIVPQQALALANSALVRNQSRVLARALATEAGASPERFVQLAFEQIVNRPASAAEVSECVRFLADQASRLADVRKLTPNVGPMPTVPPSPDPAIRAREDLVQVMMNHHEFVTMR
jgi:hypothetical protein